jgi:hypothetical protein
MSQDFEAEPNQGRVMAARALFGKALRHPTAFTRSLSPMEKERTSCRPTITKTSTVRLQCHRILPSSLKKEALSQQNRRAR